MSARVSLGEIRSFVVRCLTAVGTKEDHAGCMAELLLSADYRGHYSHGINRLDIYVRDMKAKTCVSDKEPVVLKETAATAFVEGNNLLGPVVGKFCIDLAIKKAKEAGIGWVVAKGSNHFGICGWYSMRAMEHGLIGMAYTNTSPLLVPTRAKVPALGTNPLSVAAPGENGDSFVLDMASTTVALGKVEIQNRKEEPIPSGWAVDKEGRVTTDSTAALEAGALLPLGGTELTSGYKGYGLCMMVEVFCGILSGSAFGPNIRKWMDTSVPADLGQCFVALDPNAFAPGFEDRMSQLMNVCRNLDSADSQKPVLVPGDPEREHMSKCDREGGITYHVNQIKHCNELAKSLGVEPIKTLG